MINIKNIFKPNSRSVMKLSLTLKGLVGTIATSSFVQGNAKFAFYALAAGAIIEFIISLLPPDTEVKPTVGNEIKALLLISSLVVSFMLTGCWSQRTELKQKTVHTDTTTINHSVKDTTITTYKAVDFHIIGATVQHGVNIDSLVHAALMAKDQRQADSITNLNLELQYKRDSITALKTGLALPQAPALKDAKPVVQYYTDPQTKAQLAYWIDAYGKFQITCQSKDQTITVQQAQIKVLEQDVTDKQRQITDLKSKTVTVFQTPSWAWWVMGISVLLNLFFIALKFLKIAI